MDKLEALSRCELFQELSTNELSTLAQSFRQRRYLRGQVVFLEGRPAEVVCVVASGSVKLTQDTLEGHELILRVVHPGEAFGAVAALIGDVYPLTAVAREDSTVLCCSASRFRELVEDYPSISRRALRIVSARLREAFARIRELSLERVDRRIARTLLRAADGNLHRPGGPVVRLTRQELAELAGTTLTTASRTVARFHRLGVVRAGRQNISILSVDGLRAIAEESETREGWPSVTAGLLP